jgi:phospholipase C
MPNPWRGCGHPIPGHGWFAGRRDLTEGFLGEGTGNDDYALGYYQREDLPMHAGLADRFTICDHHFSSLMGPTFPNRQYLHSAQSGGEREDPIPIRSAQWTTETIEDRLMAAHVPVGYYYTDLPILLLWGERFAPIVHPLDVFFEQCAAGTLPKVVFVDPGFGGNLRTDDHPYGDVRLGQRFASSVFNAFVASKHWKRGLFVLTYDEWGGFFDHVRPPLLADDRAVPDLELSFGLAGFRVPTFLASPYAPRNFVDHRVYDHTSILRFIEWRFLGAPAEGLGTRRATWFLTARDRAAHNIGASLGNSQPDPDVGKLADLAIPTYSPACVPDKVPHPAAPPDGHDDPFQLHDSLEELLVSRYPAARQRPWVGS